MSRIRSLLPAIAVLALCLLGLGTAQAADNTIAPGTTITMKNWRQYKAVMPDGMIALFDGSVWWKMPPDVQIDVGPTTIHPLPKPFWDAVEKYSAQTRFLKLPNGAYKLENYVAGVPFPHPSGPDKGTEIAADVTFRPGGHLYVGMPDSGTPASFCTMDKFSTKACTRVDYNYRQLAYNWFPGVSHTEPGSTGAWYGEWLMVEKPEEAKYSADLTLLWQDVTRLPDDYVFIPALRQTMRLSTAARCAPLFGGSDATHDDQRAGWNGGASMFEGKFLREQNILALVDMTTAMGKFPDNYDMPLGWAMPSWGKWEVIPVWVTDVRRIESMRSGYCYGKRIMYTAEAYFANVHEDLYDSNMKLWKVVNIGLRSREDKLHPEWGPQYFGGGIIEQYWNMQNEHASHIFTADANGKDLWADRYAPQYDDIARYQTPGGLSRVMH
jgi:hypothetical protein